MPPRVPWLSPIHYEIVGFLDEHDIWISPRALAENLDYDRSYTARECAMLSEVGLLRRQGNIYALSDMGEQFTRGEVGPDDLQSPDGTVE